MRILLALFAALLLLSVGSGATASTSTPPQNGLIAVNGPEGIYVVDPLAGTTKLVPKTAESGFRRGPPTEPCSRSHRWTARAPTSTR